MAEGRGGGQSEGEGAGADGSVRGSGGDKDPLSDKAIGRMLGGQWELVHEEKYEWHYEWRFYIFHTWRRGCGN